MEGKLGDCGEAREDAGLFASRIGAVPWTLRDVLLAAALFVPVGVGGSFGLGFALARLSAVGSDIQAVIVGSALLPASLVAGAWFFGMRRHGVSWASLGFRGATLGSLTLLPMIALAVGLTATGLYALLADALGADMLVPEQNLDKLRELDGIARLPTFAVVGLLAPFGEEVFFRGFLLAALVPVIGGLRGALVSAAIFSAAHLNVSTLFPIFVMGMLLAWLYLRTGSILPSFVAHAGQNLLALVFLEIPFDAPAAGL